MAYNGYNQYQRSEVTSASPGALVVLLYTELLRCLTAAREAHLDGDSAVKSKQTGKAIRVLTELMGSVDMEKGGIIAKNLVMLYRYIAKNLLAANRTETTIHFDEAIRLLLPLKTAWETIAVSPSEPSPVRLGSIKA
jgi:flagellar protein FliS